MRKSMKKTVSALLLFTLVLFTAACSGHAETKTDGSGTAAAVSETAPAEETVVSDENETDVPAENVQLAGGWSFSDDPAISGEIAEVFGKATETLCGVEYVPVAYLGSQVVAGTNHCILCRADVSVAELQDGSQSYVLMYIYEDLDGNAEIMNIAGLDISSFAEYGQGD